MAHPRVLSALSAAPIGHLDPELLRYMDDIQGLLRWAFRTRNALTFAVSGTGSAGMEASLVNVLEPGDRVVVAQHGVFGARMTEIASRIGCRVAVVEVPFGQALDPAQVELAVRIHGPKAVLVVHAETSTGVLQPVAEIAAVARAASALCIVDCVTSLGGVPVEVDAWGIDVAYSGTQKCLSCPPGLAPVTFSERAVEALQSRKTKVSSWYLDASLLLAYWGQERAYHHTAPINMLYALREALRVLRDEGLEQAFARHALHGGAIAAGLQALGLRLPVAPAHRMPQLTVVNVPDGVDDAVLRRALLERHSIEVGGGLGPLKGKVLRIGLMGHTAQRANVERLLTALEQELAHLGIAVTQGRALQAASAAYAGT
jgi:alanine-glyoxylate transaminase/serine-glyoxylate transaminase/serine-pyruvate transaminase